ncbi:hypothetical protein [Sphingomonas spermidinifaciens]|uniref:hypothetical protein n=1 Tax=Sphingomonas spermidinifaciens TaxID=1141889 RepID=UPI0011415908|nr:hypothetical protein [Sphingomonas spermidinifaciens]
MAIGDGPGTEAAVEAARASGARVAGRVSLAEGPGRLAMQARLHVLTLDLPGGEPDAATIAALDAAAAAAHRHDALVIASCPVDALDLVASSLEGVRAALLCEPTLVDRVAAFALAGPPPRTLHDAARDSDQRRLRQLNDEVARIAETLARLARTDPGTAMLGSQVADRAPPYRAVPDEGEPAIDPADVRAAIRARRMRDQFFEGDLFADPAWDMLLDLYAAHLEHQRVSVSSLCIAAAVPATTALRWITTMREAGLFERHDDPFDRRRAYVGLSETAITGMRRYCAAVRRAGLSIA